ncbi:U2 small nuclear ribonucleoprotein auxiliary factor 35 kDa subunit-related protein 1 isoform X2 [Wyeomyia smithii]|uniref:U2 small nuclear ribonucleoprotein auxiliary factor 35 kDa subunit-related protein 1 isoform X2 n=1 Tax=Wyeomyia smithii TaxID=174621 RepID=UPI002467B3A3|nr:U2 small nuclear ribonucleoprotein auxiliary factor 35 kDa subunit-related protein 1 isoform X2 [Wyeomyia smithii]
MDNKIVLRRKDWRKLFKKMRRKRIRRRVAQDRDRQLAEIEKLKLNNPSYVAYLQEKERSELLSQQQQEELSRYENALWMDREMEFQLAYKEKQKQFEAAAKQEHEKRSRIRKEFEEQMQKANAMKAEKERLLTEFRQKQQERERMLAEYLMGIDDNVATLRETIHSRAGANPCSFFSKIGSCRYGLRCSSDHQTPSLSELILIPNFFAHPALDDQQHPEYGNDLAIEFDEDELNRCYRDFFFDIIEEFEQFGTITTIFTCRNFEPHLKGHVFIQYNDMRSAAKAFQRMNGRFYASRQLHIEFRSPIAWTSAVCGLFEQSRCQKGKVCNYLHLMVNPVSKYRYDHFKELQSARSSRRLCERTPMIQRTWDEIENSIPSKTNWRWSESPAVEITSRSRHQSSRQKSPDQKESTIKHCTRDTNRERRSSYNSARRRRSRSKSSDRSDRHREHDKHRSRSPSNSMGDRKTKERFKSTQSNSRKEHRASDGLGKSRSRS